VGKGAAVTEEEARVAEYKPIYGNKKTARDFLAVFIVLLNE
jgi:hypothetical protein